jgi:hypothetical protein
VELSMGLSALLGLAGNLVGVGPLVWAVIRRMATRSARTGPPKGSAGACGTFTVEVRVEGPAHAASVTATATLLMPEHAATAQGIAAQDIPARILKIRA